MEVMMKMIQRKQMISLLGIAMVMSITSGAQAQWPTLDIAAIKEGISSKIELVKQSKIVTETTQLAGKMNTTIGDAKGSMSKFAGDNLQKAKEQAEKLQKEKERLEENKKKLDKAREKAQKAKEQYEKAQKAMAEAKETINEAKETVNEAKSKVDEAKAVANDVKSQVEDAKQTVNEAKETVNDAKSLAQDKVSSVQNQVDNVRSDVNAATGNNSTNQDTFVEDYVANYEAGINSDAKVYETVQPQSVSEVNVLTPQAANSTITPQGVSAEVLPINQDSVEPTTQEMTDMGASAIPSEMSTETTPQNAVTNKSFRKPFAIKAKVKDENAISSDQSVTETSTTTKAGIPAISSAKRVQAIPTTVEGETSAVSSTKRAKAIPATAKAGTSVVSSTQSQVTKSVIPQADTSTVSTGTVSSSKGFRQRAIIKNDTTLDKGASLEIMKSTKIASYKSSQTLMFGAEDYIPDGVVHNGVYEETIIPPTLVEYCSIGVDKLNDPTVMEECLKKLIRHMSDSDSQVAAEGKRICNKIVAETTIAMVSESMQMKNIAANSKEQVSDKFDEQAGSASTTRDDSAILAQSNKINQNSLNQGVTMSAGQLVQTVISQLCGLTAESLGEESEEGEE